MTMQSAPPEGEYASLREEILTWIRFRATYGLTIAALTAGLYAYAGGNVQSTAAPFALLIPQIFVLCAYAFLRRNSQLMWRLACYVAVFHELPRGGGWELLSRYPFADKAMQASHRRVWLIASSIYTTHAVLLAILFSSAGLLALTFPFLWWGLTGIVLPVLILVYHILRTRRARCQQGKYLREWYALRQRLATETVDSIYERTVAAFEV